MKMLATDYGMEMMMVFLDSPYGSESVNECISDMKRLNRVHSLNFNVLFVKSLIDLTELKGLGMNLDFKRI